MFLLDRSIWYLMCKKENLLIDNNTKTNKKYKREMKAIP